MDLVNKHRLLLSKETNANAKIDFFKAKEGSNLLKILRPSLMIIIIMVDGFL